MIIMHASPISSKIAAPFKWGDVVKVNRDTTEIIYMPDTNCGESKTFILSRGINEYGHYQRASRYWREMEVIGGYDTYADNEEIVALMEKYRKCVCINVMKWTSGVDFFFNKYDDLVQKYVLHNQKWQEEESTGTLDIVEKWWAGRPHEWRVLSHRSDSWDTWSMSGPFADESKARNVFEHQRIEALNNPPKFIKYGIYRNDNQINCISLYKGPYLVARHSLLIGQGEELKYADGINRDVEEFEIPGDYRQFH